MAWTNMGTKANGVVIDQGDWNQMVNNFANNGGADGNTKTGHWVPTTDLTVNLGDPTHRWSALYGQLVTTGNNLYLRSGQSAAGGIYIDTSSNQIFAPEIDNKVGLGGPSNRWGPIYSNTGTINTSRREYKEGFAPIDPAHALDVVRRTPILSYVYKVLPSRRFAGFIADDADPLLSPDQDSVDPGSMAAVAMAAVQALATKVDALEAAR